VTTLLSENEPSGIIEWRKRVGEEQARKIMLKAANRGTYVHNQLENLINDSNYIVEDATPVKQEMVSLIWNFLKENMQVCYGTEMQLYSDNLRLAGTTDLIAKINGVKYVVDFKTAAYPKDLEYIDNYHNQLSIYSYMVFERYGLNIPNLLCIIATETGELQTFLLKRKSIPSMLKLFPPGHLIDVTKFTAS
jgi:genome maintenance exonuclease 1